MLNRLRRLNTEQKIHPPKFLLDNCMYLCQMGSVAYGTATDYSDVDVYGFCIPPKNIIFPQVDGKILGFDQINGFDQWSEHHVVDSSDHKEYDFSVYSIIKYFHLVMTNNPNTIDSLFVPRNCVLHSTAISEYVRENRKLFLHRGCWSKFKGYSFSQMTKMKNKNPDTQSKRYESVQKFGYDVKFAVHLVRLLYEVEQILTEGDLDLQRNREQLKSFRSGEYTTEEVLSIASKKEQELETVYLNSFLPYGPDIDSIRQILIDCLEIHYGSISNIINTSKTDSDKILDQIRLLVK